MQENENTSSTTQLVRQLRKNTIVLNIDFNKLHNLADEIIETNVREEILNRLKTLESITLVEQIGEQDLIHIKKTVLDFAHDLSQQNTNQQTQAIAKLIAQKLIEQFNGEFPQIKLVQFPSLESEADILAMLKTADEIRNLSIRAPYTQESGRALSSMRRLLGVEFLARFKDHPWMIYINLWVGESFVSNGLIKQGGAFIQEASWLSHELKESKLRDKVHTYANTNSIPIRSKSQAALIKGKHEGEKKLEEDLLSNLEENNLAAYCQISDALFQENVRNEDFRGALYRIGIILFLLKKASKDNSFEFLMLSYLKSVCGWKARINIYNSLKEIKRIWLLFLNKIPPDNPQLKMMTLQVIEIVNKTPADREIFDEDGILLEGIIAQLKSMPIYKEWFSEVEEVTESDMQVSNDNSSDSEIPVINIHF